MVFASPETSFKGMEPTKLICMETSWENLVAYVIDEAQCRSKRVCSYNVFLKRCIHLFIVISLNTLTNSSFYAWSLTGCSLQG